MHLSGSLPWEDKIVSRLKLDILISEFRNDEHHKAKPQNDIDDN